SSRAGSIAIPADQLVKELYEFENGVRAIVTRLKRPGGEGKIVGSQTFKIKGAKVIMKDTAIVDEGFRKQGIGSAQLEEVIRAAKARGSKTLSSSGTNLAEAQRTSYSRAALATGADIKMGTEIEYSQGSYSPKEGYEGPILEVDLKNVEKGTTRGFKKGSQELLEHLEDRLALANKQIPPSQIKAEKRAQKAAIEADKVRSHRALATAAREGQVMRDQQSLKGQALKETFEKSIAGSAPEDQAEFRRIKAIADATGETGVGPAQWELPDESKGKISPKLKGIFSTLGKILAPLGALLQGANIGGLAHKAERGMVDQEEIAKELGREIGITGLATAGALGGGA
ncbi:hypothetical protein LCGC14_3117240, partial [marine sediment metagenome]